MKEDRYICPNAGPVKNPNAILEAADGSDDTDINDNHCYEQYVSSFLL
jgi:hypothetical protein